METLALVILGGLAMLAAMYAATVAARRGSPTADPGAGSLVFRYARLVRWGSVGFAAGVLGAVTAMVVASPPPDADEAVAAVLSYVLFGALAAPLLWDVFRFRLEVGPDGLDCRSPWRRRRFVRWEDVADVSFNGPQGWFDARTREGRAVRVPALIGGLEEFLEACERHLTPGQLGPARMAYVYLGREFPGG